MDDKLRSYRLPRKQSVYNALTSLIWNTVRYNHIASVIQLDGGHDVPSIQASMTQADDVTQNSSNKILCRYRQGLPAFPNFTSQIYTSSDYIWGSWMKI
uniref:Ubiquitinyl hydrolase 1 n=1 Tax=Heterorhabditis bacteriophora TaxID=37862 RepID=A0A1I7X863_HETBA